mmetsp:Transcript_19230/g.30477  ORF Transcript_19230/g.30477 Transcript_19230/m.30477 type:complete len:419 (+) Transcript_19230:106-1362(+)
MLSQNKTVNYVVGGIAIASIALLAYTVTRPIKEPKKSKTKSKSKSKRKDGRKKFKCTLTKKPIDINLVMESMDGFNAHVAGDKKNAKLGLKYGARLIKINQQKVENLPFEEVFDILTQKAKFPITLQFVQLPELNARWTKAESLKDEANADFKSNAVETAIEKVSNAIELHPTNKIYYSNRILMYFKANKYDEALADCQSIRELDPKAVYLKGHYLRGLTLLHLKKYKNAASAFQTVVKLNPAFKKATDRLTECMKEIERENQQSEKRRSSQHEELANQFAAKDKEPSDDKADEKEQQLDAKDEAKEQDQEKEKEKEKEAAATEEKTEMDVDVDVNDNDKQELFSGYYELCGIVTHKGRSANSGHYIGYAKDKQRNKWLKFDDDEVTEIKSDDIKQLYGGGDFQMAFLTIYRRIDADL